MLRQFFERKFECKSTERIDAAIRLFSKNKQTFAIQMVLHWFMCVQCAISSSALHHRKRWDMRDRSTHRHVSSNIEALKINNCKLDRCEMASQISIHSDFITTIIEPMLSCLPFFLSCICYTYPIGKLTKKKTWILRGLFCCRHSHEPCPHYQQFWSGKNSTFNVYFMIHDWFVARHHSSSSFFARCLLNGVSWVWFLWQDTRWDKFCHRVKPIDTVFFSIITAV